MFIFSIWESLFLVSMALGFFYSWQTYSQIENEVNDMTLREVYYSTIVDMKQAYDKLCFSTTLGKIMFFVSPVMEKLEQITGRGGNLRYNGNYQTIPYHHKKKDDDSAEDSDSIQLVGNTDSNSRRKNVNTDTNQQPRGSVTELDRDDDNNTTNEQSLHELLNESSSDDEENALKLSTN